MGTSDDQPLQDGVAPRGHAPDDALERVRSSGAGWAAPSAPAAALHRRGSSLRRIVAALAAMSSLGAAGWYGSGAYLEGRALQEAADAWDAARVCLVGDGLRNGSAPSERLRLIEMAVRPSRQRASGEREDDWPGRCQPHAERLDRALAARSLVRLLGELPPLTPLTTAEDLRTESERIDRLHAELELASLPHPRRDATVPPAPAPARPRLERDQLAALGRVESLADIDVAFDPSRGSSLRLLLPEKRPLVCRFNDGPRSQRWQSAACRATPLELLAESQALLTVSTPGGPDLLHVRDAGEASGFYDGNTGQRLLQPRYFDAQAVMRDDGSAELLYADLAGEGIADRVERFRLMRMRPGRRPKRHRLQLSPQARVRLEPERVLWWVEERPSDDERFRPRDALFASALGTSQDDAVLGRSERLGELPLGSRLFGSCASRGSRATLFAAGVKERRFTLLLEGDGASAKLVDVGSIAGAPTLSCTGKAAIVTRHLGRVASSWRCTAEGCVPSNAGPLPTPEPGLAEVASVGEHLALAWAEDGTPLRLRVAAADELHEAKDSVLFDDEMHGGFEPVAVRWLAGNGMAVLLLHDVGRRVYALRVTEGGNVTPVRVAR